MGMSRLVRATLEPTLNALYTVPKLALISIFLIVLGFDNKPIIAVIAVTVFFFVWIQTQSAVTSIAPSYREAARSFGSGRWQMFRHVVLPASLPQIFVGLRIAAGVAVLTLIGVEFVFTPDQKGIGYKINNARTIFDPPQAYVGLVVAGILGVVFTFVIRLVGRFASPGRRRPARSVSRRTHHASDAEARAGLVVASNQLEGITLKQRKRWLSSPRSLSVGAIARRRLR